MLKKRIAKLATATIALLGISLGIAPAANADNEPVTQATNDTTAQLSVTAPAEIPYTLNLSGTFTTPSADSTQITNKSSVPVAVKSYSVTTNKNTSPVLQKDYANSKGLNSWWSTVKIGDNGKTTPFNISTNTLDSDWNLSASGAGHDTIGLTLAGAMKNINLDFSNKTQIANISWVFSTEANSGDCDIPDPDNGEAFAVYSADDNSFNFYKRKAVPNEGTRFDGRTATKIYTGIENLDVTYQSDVPWLYERSYVISSRAVDDGIKPISVRNWFAYMSSMVTCDIDKIDTSKCTSFESLFMYCVNLETLNISKLDTSNITSLSLTFLRCSKLTNIDLSAWNTSKLTTTYETFASCSAIKDFSSIEKWNTSSLTSMKEMFASCSSIERINLKNWELSKITDASSTFIGCVRLTEITINNTLSKTTPNFLGTPLTDYIPNADGKWYSKSSKHGYDPSEIPPKTADTYYAYPPTTFAVYSATDNSLDFYKRFDFEMPSVGSTFNGKIVTARYDNVGETKYSSAPWSSYAGKITNSEIVDDGIQPKYIDHWFENMTQLATCNVTKLDTSSLLSCIAAFSNDASLATLDTTNWNLSQVQNTSYMFYGCKKLNGLNTSNWQLSYPLGQTTSMFQNCSSLTALNTTNWTLSAVVNTGYMFAGCSSLTLLDTTQWGIANANDMQYMFFNCSKLKTINISSWNTTANNRYFQYMFGNCNALTTLDVAKIKTTSALDMQGMFQNCASLSAIDVSGFDTTNVTDISYMFDGCASVTQLIVQTWKTSNVKTLDLTFSNCPKLVTVPATTWDTSNCESFSAVFMNDENLQYTGANTWNTAKSNNFWRIFYNCKAITSITSLPWDVSSAENLIDAFNGCESLPMLDLHTWDVTLAEKNKYTGGMFLGCKKLQQITLSDKFTFPTADSHLIEPSSQYINGADGKWHSTTDYTAYTPLAIPTKKADTYTAIAPTLAGTVTVSGDFKVGSTLTASASDFSKYATASYTWTRDGKAISGATKNTYTLTTSDYSHSIVCVISDSANKYTGTISSTAKAVGKGTASAPTVTISETKNIEEILTATVTGQPTGTTSTTYQWQRSSTENGTYVNIPNATKNTYTIVDDDADCYIRCVVKTINTYYTVETGYSNGYGETAFAVYSDDDKSLDFYKRRVLPSAGERLENKTVTAVYTGIEKFYYFVNNVPWLSNRKYIQTVTVVDSGIKPLSTAYWFSDFEKLTTININKLDTSNTSDMSGMFQYCLSLTSLDISTFKTQQVVNMSSMFKCCNNITEILGIDKIDTSSCEDMSDLFYECSSLTTINISNFNTSNVYKMTKMFYLCVSLTSIIGLENFDTSHVTDMYRMFDTCALTILDLSNFDTKNVQYMEDMFKNMKFLNTVILGNKFQWIGTNGYLPVPDSYYISGARGCWYAKSDNKRYYPENIPSNKADTYTAVSSIQAFAVYSEDDQSLNFYKRNEVPNVDDTFEEKTVTAIYTGIEYTNQSPDWDEYASSIEKVAVIDNGIQPINTSFWFSNFPNMTQCDISKLDVSYTTSMNSMFYRCSSISTIGDVSNWDTSNVTDMSRMFYLCRKLTNIDSLSNWDTSNVTNMSSMFGSCSVTDFDSLSNWNTSNVTNMTGTFSSCPITNVNSLSNWDTSNVTNMSSIFSGCSQLVTANLLNWNTSNVINMKQIFSNCSELVIINLSNWDTSNVTDMSNIFSNCNKLQEVTLGNKWQWIGTNGYLPTPTSTYITDADGKWYALSSNTSYLATSIPSNKADTYYAAKALRDASISKQNANNQSQVESFVLTNTTTEILEVRNSESQQQTNTDQNTTNTNQISITQNAITTNQQYHITETLENNTTIKD